MDDGFVNRVWPGGGAAARVKQANELVAWHPDRGLQTLFEYPGPAPLSKFHQVLPGRRVLLIDTGTAHRKLNIRIVPLDGTPPREIYPYSRQGLLRN
jgi:hypothetical protein